MTEATFAAPSTIDSRRRLEAEIHRLKRDVRPGVARAITDTARAHGMGDISAAKAQLESFDARIAHLERRLAASVAVNPALPEDPSQVGFGAQVVCRRKDGSIQILTLVGAEEADPASGRVSSNAPVARALAGARAGDAVEAMTPRGPVSLEVIEITYPEDRGLAACEGAAQKA